MNINKQINTNLKFSDSLDKIYDLINEPIDNNEISDIDYSAFYINLFKLALDYITENQDKHDLNNTAREMFEIGNNPKRILKESTIYNGRKEILMSFWEKDNKGVINVVDLTKPSTREKIIESLKKQINKEAWEIKKYLNIYRDRTGQILDITTIKWLRGYDHLLKQN